MNCFRCGARMSISVDEADALAAKVQLWCPICLHGYCGILYAISTHEVRDIMELTRHKPRTQTI